MTNEYDSDPNNIFLSTRQLSDRHQVSQKKLANDRLAGRGIPFFKIGRLCRYRMSDVMRYEQEQLRRSTSDIGGGHE